MLGIARGHSHNHYYYGAIASSERRRLDSYVRACAARWLLNTLKSPRWSALSALQSNIPISSCECSNLQLQLQLRLREAHVESDCSRNAPLCSQIMITGSLKVTQSARLTTRSIANSEQNTERGSLMTRTE